MENLKELQDERTVVLDALNAATETNDSKAEADMRQLLAEIDADIAKLKASAKTQAETKPKQTRSKNTAPKDDDIDFPTDEELFGKKTPKSKDEWDEIEASLKDFEANWAETEKEIERIIKTPVSRKKPATTRLKPSWKKDITIEQIKTLGFVYSVAVADGTCEQIAVELNQDVDCTVKGDVTAKAKAGELVIFVHTEGENWRQFNIIGNKNNCTLRLAKTSTAGKQEEVTALAKEVAKTEKARIQKARAKRETMADKIHKAIDLENKKGERKSDDTSYWGGKSKFMAVAKAVMILTENHKAGATSKQIVSILRDSDNRIIFEMAELNGKEFKDAGREYLLLDERKIQLSTTEKPKKPYGVVDARKADMEKHGTAIKDYAPVSDSRYLDSIYAGRSVEAKECKQLEKASRACQAGNCPKGSAEEKELKHLESECTRHLDPYSKLMPVVQKAFKEFYKKGFTVYADKARGRGKKMSTSEAFNVISDANPEPQ